MRLQSVPGVALPDSTLADSEVRAPRERPRTLESEVRELQAVNPVPRPAAPPLPPGAASRMLGLLAEMALSHVAVGELDDAQRVTVDAIRLLDAVAEDARADLRSAARARAALGRALLALNDPAGRELLENARGCFATLGDEAATLAIDAALHAAPLR